MMVIPVILESDIEEIKRKITLIENVANLVQIDIADGKLVKGQTVTDISELEDFETSCVYEIHLMVSNPLDYLETKLRKAIKICSQVEVPAHDVKAFIKKAKDMGYKVGLSLLEDTQIKDLDPYLDEIDYVQFVAVEAGAQGRPFHDEVLEKIKKLRKLRPHLYIQVDGGIDEENFKKILKAGANGAVIGSHIFNTPNPEEAVAKFKQLSTAYADRT